MQSWMLVIMLWGGTATTGAAVTTAPGLYQTEAACTRAAAAFNTETEVMTGVNTAAVCVPGPLLLMTPTKK